MPAHSNFKTPEKANAKTAEKLVITKPQNTPTKPNNFPSLTPAKAQHTPAKAQHTPAKAQHTPAKAQHTPAKAQHTPAKAQQPPAKAQQTPAKAQQTPAKAQQTPAKAQQTPAKVQSTPALPVQKAKLLLLHKAVKNEWCDYIKYVAKSNHDLLNTENDEGDTSVLVAAKFGTLSSFRQLAEGLANIHSKNRLQGENIAHIAISMGHIGILKEFHRYGGNVNLPAKDQFTPAHHAVIGNKPPLVNALIECGANFDIKTKINISILQMFINLSANAQTIEGMQRKDRLKKFIKEYKCKNSNHILISPYDIAVIIGNRKMIKSIAAHSEQQQQTKNKFREYAAKNVPPTPLPKLDISYSLSPLQNRYPSFFRAIATHLERTYDEAKAPLTLS